ncbi:MAG: hypothetical protein ACOX5G_10160 [Kiritimatiellia bacterium]|jgi:hypothetical protein
MDAGIGRNLGEQPIAALLAAHGLAAHDLVEAAPTPITHKMVARAMKGRRLTRHTAELVRAALNRAAKADYALADLFTYDP